MRKSALKLGTVAFLPAFALLTVTAQADDFAAAGTRATLRVEYIYESSGSERSEGMYDPYQWQVNRTATLEAKLEAQVPTALPTMQALNETQTADLESKAAKAQQLSTDMAPMMADAQAIMEKCGEDEACITAEAMKMGAAMSGTPEMDAAMKAGKEGTELAKQGAPRYQAWRSTLQTGTYRIDEKVHISVPDPICMSLPNARCTRDELRAGSGQIPVPDSVKNSPGAVAGYSGVEVDSDQGTIVVNLPVPMFPLPYTETITTNEPEGTHDTPTPVGPQQQLMSFRVNAKGGSTNDQPLVIPLDGDWHRQSGQQVFTLQGQLREAGTLTVRWHFDVQ